MMTDLPTPEELLNRAMDALDKAEAKTDPFYTADWIGVSQAATMAGQLALDIRQAEPRTVVIENLSGLGQALMDKVIEDPNIPDGQAVMGKFQEPLVLVESDPRVKEGRQVWVNPDEWEDLLAVRAGAATVMYRKPPAEAPESPVNDLADVAGTHDHPTDHEESVVDFAAELRENLNAQERRYRSIIVGLLLARSTVSEYVPGALIRQTPPWELFTGENPADGAVTLRIERGLTEPV